MFRLALPSGKHRCNASAVEKSAASRSPLRHPCVSVRISSQASRRCWLHNNVPDRADQKPYLGTYLYGYCMLFYHAVAALGEHGSARRTQTRACACWAMRQQRRIFQYPYKSDPVKVDLQNRIKPPCKRNISHVTHQGVGCACMDKWVHNDACTKSVVQTS